MVDEPDERRDMIDVLTEDHREVEEIFTQLESLPFGQEERRTLVDQMTMELVRHAVAEEQYLYPSARKMLPDGDEVADRELSEHAEVEKLLKELERLDVSDADFDKRLGELMTAVRQHVQEEEGMLFPRLVVAASRDELLDLGDKITRAKRIAPTRAHPSAPDRPPLNKLLAPGAGLVDRVRDALSGRGRS
jgi:hemerythrin superfamily protein